MPPWAEGARFEASPELSIELLNHSLDLLATLNEAGRGTVIRAVSAIASHDGEITSREAALIRAACATLELPLPPILVKNDGPATAPA